MNEAEANARVNDSALEAACDRFKSPEGLAAFWGPLDDPDPRVRMFVQGVLDRFSWRKKLGHAWLFTEVPCPKT